MPLTNQNRTLLFAGLGLLGIFIYSKVKAGQQLQISLADLKDWKISGSTIQLTIEFSIINPSNKSFAIKYVSGDFLINGQYVGRAQTTSPVIIPSNSNVSLQVPVELTNDAIVQSLLQYMQTGTGQKLQVTFRGQINVDGIPLPIAETVQL